MGDRTLLVRSSISGGDNDGPWKAAGSADRCLNGDGNPLMADRVSVADLPTTLKVNSIPQWANFIYVGADAAAGSWPTGFFGFGSLTAMTVTGSPAPTYGQSGFPGCNGPKDGSVLFNGGAYFTCADGSFGDIDTITADDVSFFMIVKTPAAGTKSVASHLDAIWVGWLMNVNATSIQFSTTYLYSWATVETGALTPNTWYVAQLFWKRSTNLAQWYINGVASGAAAALTPAANSLSRTAESLWIGAAYGGAGSGYGGDPFDSNLAYLGMWKHFSPWFDTHLQASIAADWYSVVTRTPGEAQPDNLTAETLHLRPEKGSSKSALTIDMGGTGVAGIADVTDPAGILIQVDGGTTGGPQAIEIRNKTTGGRFLVDASTMSVSFTGALCIATQTLPYYDNPLSPWQLIDIDGDVIEPSPSICLRQDVYNVPAIAIANLDGATNDVLRCYIMGAAGQPNPRTLTIDKYGSYSSYGYLDIHRLDNGQSCAFKSLTELTTIAAAATTSTAIQIPAKAVVIGVSVRVTVVIPTATTFTVGVTGDAACFGAGLSVAANTTNPGTQSALTKYVEAATSILITPSATPADNSGRVRVTIHYVEITPPTS